MIDEGGQTLSSGGERSDGTRTVHANQCGGYRFGHNALAKPSERLRRHAGDVEAVLIGSLEEEARSLQSRHARQLFFALDVRQFVPEGNVIQRRCVVAAVHRGRIHRGDGVEELIVVRPRDSLESRRKWRSTSPDLHVLDETRRKDDLDRTVLIEHLLVRVDEVEHRPHAAGVREQRRYVPCRRRHR